MASPAPLPGLDASECELVQEAPAPAHARLMKAVLSREPFSDPEWIYRAKARRDPLPGDPRGRPAGDALAQRSRSQRALSRGRRRAGCPAPARASPSTARWSPSTGDRRALPAWPSAGIAGSPSSTTCSTCCGSRGPTSARCRCGLASGCCATALSTGGALRLSTHRNREGEAMFAHACRQGWEGVIAKRADSPYRETRSRDWLKFKCEAGPGAGHRRLHRPARQPHGARRAAARLLRRRRAAALRGQGRHRLRSRDARRPRRPVARPAARHLAV